MMWLVLECRIGVLNSKDKSQHKCNGQRLKENVLLLGTR